MQKGRPPLLGLGLALVASVGPADTKAQSGISADSIMAIVASDVHSPTMPGGPIVREFFLNPGQYLDGLRDEVVASMEVLVRNKVGSAVYRQAVVNALLAAGSKRSTDPLSGMVDRLAAIFEASEDRVVKLLIVHGLASSAERESASAFLSQAAAEKGPWAKHAVGSLQELGPEGRAALVHLHQGGDVVDPEARAVLLRSAERGFQPYRKSKMN